VGGRGRTGLKQQTIGFTLVELLVVIAVISILMAVLLPSVGRSVAAARSVRCQTSLRSILFDFSVFADANIHPKRGDDETRTPGRFSLETFVESQYGVDEFWEFGSALTALRQPAKGSEDPMRCAEVAGVLTMKRGVPCGNGAVTPPQNVSYGFNMRLWRPDHPGQPRIKPVLLNERVLDAGRAPLVWDVDGAAAVNSNPGANPTFTAPPQGTSGPYANGSIWWPGQRHSKSMNVGFIDGSVGSSQAPLEQAGWRWDFRAR
jgi:prepilin-type N-terminal cleavage/methylation domain-containing protein/prepilin-type processing-associated H-X9-DG protein